MCNENNYGCNGARMKSTLDILMLCIGGLEGFSPIYNHKLFNQNMLHNIKLS